MNVKELLISDGFWAINKKMIKNIGGAEAILFSVLAEAENMFQSKNKWFFQTIKDIEDFTGYTKHQQARLIKQLKKQGLITQRNMGVPQKRYFKINHNAVKKICSFKTLKIKTKYHKFLQSSYWQDVRFKVLDRDNNTCQYCGATTSLQVHHLTYEHHGEEMEYLEDLIALCKDCHKKEHNIK